MSLFFAYIGPETLLPLGSVLAAIGGLFLFFWRYTGGLIINLFRKKPKDDEAI
jgi:hypothetical protein